MGINQKHIAIICNYELLKDRVGGMDYFFWAFNKACTDKGIKVDWFFPNIGTHGDYHTFEIFPSNGVTLEQGFIRHIKKQPVQYSYIVTHFVELCTSFFATVKKHQQARIIAVDHNPRPLLGYPFKKRLKKRIKGILYSKYIDLFIGVSNYTSQAILNDFGNFLKPKTQTIYNGVLIDDIIPKTAARRRVNPKFLVVSHLRESKGIQDLIKAVHLLPDNLKVHLKVDVYGDGPYEKELLKLVENYKLEINFNFKGSQSNLKALCQHYDYLIQPTHMECFSLSILESLAANIPVITTPVGGNLEVIKEGKNGFVFKTKNIKELAVLLEDVINGNKYIEGPTRNLIKTQFSLDDMVDNYLRLLD
ncbi:glycosyltransferase family 4 protein [Thalassobellus suaedae]|uniref:Glycosyltransferase family 4 protein n=1 Tax=Thalassobellus suaedae TaxID=3074124 RepID=A0ABY9Y0R9_9FLAO|nr:glycosyltransferase family 4 protein [Flavobacteriaceae bacterium HL-DH10]